MSKVLLVYANSYMDNLIPIGVSLLSAVLKDAGHEVKLFDTTFYKTSEKTGDQARVESLQIKPTNLEEFGIKSKSLFEMSDDFKFMIKDYKPDIVGFSVVESTRHIFIYLLSILKAHLDYKGVIVAGGVYATTCFSDLVRIVDIVCVGEGEKAIVELANRIDKKESYEDIKNLCFMKESKIVKNDLNPITNLDKIPFQDWSIYEKERLYKPMGGKVWISGPVELQRGCPFSCSFCINHKLKKMYGSEYVRQRSIKKFIEEVKDKQKKYNISYLYLVAENFLSMKKEEFEDFVEQYKAVKLPFWIETRPETVTEDRIKKIKEIGCEGISIGVEHGNEEFRREILNRFVPNSSIIKAFNIAKKSGIRVCANNIIGFPTETRELIFDTINLNKELKADNIIVNIFCPYHGTALFDLCLEKEYFNQSYVAGDYRGIDAGLDMPQLSRKEIIGLQRTFPLYVKFEKDRWNEIKESEQNDKIFENLRKEFI